RSWLTLVRDSVHLGFDQDEIIPPDIEATLEAMQLLAINKLQHNLVDEERLAEALGQTLQKLLETVGEYPNIFELLDQRDLLEDMLGTIAKRYVPFFKLFPAFSNEALAILPYLKEPLFTALYELPESEHHRLTQLTHNVMHSFYKNQV